MTNLEWNMQNNPMQTLRVKGAEVEVATNKDALASLGPSVIIAGDLGTMRVNARSELNQGQSKCHRRR